MYISVILFSARIMCQFSTLTAISRRSYLFGNVSLLSTQIRKAWRYKTGKQTPQKQRTTNNTMNQKYQKDNHDLQNTSQKTKVWAERTSLKTEDELRWSYLNQYHAYILIERVINACDLKFIRLQRNELQKMCQLLSSKYVGLYMGTPISSTEYNMYLWRFLCFEPHNRSARPW